MKLHISESIRRLRRRADMTQENVADALGVTYQAVSRWESGKSYPDVELLPSLAALFGVDMDCLFGIDEENLDAQIMKFDKEAEALATTEEVIALLEIYLDTFPGEVYFKMRMLDLYCRMGEEYTDKRLPQMRRLCQYVIDHTQPNDWRRTRAVCDMIQAEDDENVDTWLIHLDRKSEVDSHTALVMRCDYRNEVQEYNRLIQEDLYNSLYKCFINDFCKRDRVNHKNARSHMEGQAVILRIMDLLRDPTTDDDAWITDRMFAYVRLAAGSFGCGEIETGYDALERCVKLCEIYASIPMGSKLKYNSPVLDEIEKNCDGAVEIWDNVIYPITCEEGWEWFNCVRNDERYKQISARVTQLYAELSAKQNDKSAL